MDSYTPAFSSSQGYGGYNTFNHSTGPITSLPPYNPPLASNGFVETSNSYGITSSPVISSQYPAPPEDNAPATSASSQYHVDPTLGGYSSAAPEARPAPAPAGSQHHVDSSLAAPASAQYHVDPNLAEPNLSAIAAANEATTEATTETTTGAAAGGGKLPRDWKYPHKRGCNLVDFREEIEQRTKNGESCNQIANALIAKGVQTSNKAVGRQRVLWGMRKRAVRNQILPLKRNPNRPPPRIRHGPDKHLYPKALNQEKRKREITEMAQQGLTPDEIYNVMKSRGMEFRNGVSTVLRLLTRWGLQELEPTHQQANKRHHSHKKAREQQIKEFERYAKELGIEDSAEWVKKKVLDPGAIQARYGLAFKLMGDDAPTGPMRKFPAKARTEGQYGDSPPKRKRAPAKRKRAAKGQDGEAGEAGETPAKRKRAAKGKRVAVDAPPAGHAPLAGDVPLAGNQATTYIDSDSEVELLDESSPTLASSRTLRSSIRQPVADSGMPPPENDGDADEDGDDDYMPVPYPVDLSDDDDDYVPAPDPVDFSDDDGDQDCDYQAIDPILPESGAGHGSDPAGPVHPTTHDQAATTAPVPAPIIARPTTHTETANVTPLPSPVAARPTAPAQIANVVPLPRTGPLARTVPLPRPAAARPAKKSRTANVGSLPRPALVGNCTTARMVFAPPAKAASAAPAAPARRASSSTNIATSAQPLNDLMTKETSGMVAQNTNDMIAEDTSDMMMLAPLVEDVAASSQIAASTQVAATTSVAASTQVAATAPVALNTHVAATIPAAPLTPEEMIQAAAREAERRATRRAAGVAKAARAQATARTQAAARTQAMASAADDQAAAAHELQDLVADNADMMLLAPSAEEVAASTPVASFADRCAIASKELKELVLARTEGRPLEGSLTGLPPTAMDLERAKTKVKDAAQALMQSMS